jgi:hypothetical protein
MVRFSKAKSDAPDMHTQLESMLDQVWRSEADWRLWDRLDAAVALDAQREQRQLRDKARDARKAA